MASGPVENNPIRDPTDEVPCESGFEDVWHVLRELHAQPKCPDWSSRLQRFCKDFWTLANDGRTIPTELVTSFVRLLMIEDAF